MTTYTTAAGKRATYKEASSSNNTYVINDDTKGATIAGSVNGDIIAIEGFATDFTASVSGRVITLKSIVDTDIVIKVQLANVTGATASFRFLDGDLTATKGAKITLGTQTLTSKAAAIAETNTLGSNDSAATFDETTGGGSNSTGTPFTLTTGVETTNGTAGGDTFSGSYVGAAADGTTAQAGDVINGGDGVDTLTIAVSGTLAGANTLVGLDTNSVEKVFVSNFDLGAGAATNTIDTTLMDNLTTVGLASSSAEGDTIFANMNSLVAAEMRSGTADLTLTYTAEAVAGAADVQTVTLGNQTAGTLTIAGVETVNVNSTLASNTLDDLVIDNATSLTVTGANNLTITAAVGFADNVDATALDATVNASAFTGRLNITLDAGDSVDVRGGSGDDTFNFAGGLDEDDVVNGGNGNDLLTVTGFADDATVAFTDLQVTNVERFSIAGADGADNDGVDLILDATDLPTTSSQIILVESQAAADGEAAESGSFTITGLRSGVALQVNNNKVDATAGDFSRVNSLNVTLADASGSADSLSVTLAGTAGHTSADNTLADLVVANVETLNIVSSFLGTTPLAAADANTLSDISADSSLTTLNISGTEEIFVSVGTEAENLATVNASAVSADMTIVVQATANQTITAGSGNDVITLGATLTSSDSINGGAGNADVLEATATGLTASTGALKVSNVEFIELTNTGTAVVNAAGILGSTIIELAGAATTTTLTNLATTHRVGLGHADLGGDEYSGTTSVALANSTGAADSITFDVFEAAANTITATGIESATFAYSTENNAIVNTTLDIDSANFRTVTITGANADAGHTLGLGTLDTDTTTLNASAYRGILTATAGAATATAFSLFGDRAYNITGSTGNDTFTVGATTGQDMTLNGNGGTDVLNMTLGDGAQDFDNITDIDTVNFTVVNNAVVTTNADADVLDGINTATRVTFTGGNSVSSVSLGGAGDTLTAVNSSVFDLSTFKGSLLNATFAADAFDNGEAGIAVQVIGGAGNDTVTASYDAANDASVSINMQNVDNFTVAMADSATELVLDMSDVSGLRRINISDASSERIELNDLAAGVTVDVISTDATASTVEVVLASTSGSSDSQTFRVGAVDANDNVALVVQDVETINISGDTANQVDLELAGLSMATDGQTLTVNFTGTNDIEIVSTNADIATINASGMGVGGSIIQTGRSRSTASTVTGSEGADTIIMMNGNDVLNGGAGSDTLDINFTAVLGGINVDLSSATDQIVSINGSSNAVTQFAFENVDLSGYTGFGAYVLGSDAANTITGTDLVDQIIGGAGNDIITGGAGIDVLEGGDGIDTFILDAATANRDLIADFGTTDVLDLNAFTTTLVEAYAEFANGTTDFTAVNVIVIAGTTAIADAAAAIANDADVAATVGIIVVSNGTDTLIYGADNLAGNGNELLLATLTGVTGANVLATLSADSFLV